MLRWEIAGLGGLLVGLIWRGRGMQGKKERRKKKKGNISLDGWMGI